MLCFLTINFLGDLSFSVGAALLILYNLNLAGLSSEPHPDVHITALVGRLLRSHPSYLPVAVPTHSLSVQPVVFFQCRIEIGWLLCGLALSL